MEEAKKKQVTVSFARSGDYRRVAATGVWGGPNANGEILCDFFVEHQQLPESIAMEINEADGSAVEIERSQADGWIREIQVGIVMRPDIAKAVGEWLIRNADLVIRPKTNSLQ